MVHSLTDHTLACTISEQAMNNYSTHSHTVAKRYLFAQADYYRRRLVMTATRKCNISRQLDTWHCPSLALIITRVRWLQLYAYIVSDWNVEYNQAVPADIVPGHSYWQMVATIYYVSSWWSLNLKIFAFIIILSTIYNAHLVSCNEISQHFISCSCSCLIRPTRIIYWY